MSKKKNKKGKYSSGRKSGTGLVMVLAVLVVILAVSIVLLLVNRPEPSEAAPQETAPHTTQAQQLQTTEVPSEAETEAPKAQGPVNLGYGIYVTDIGSYTGMYMEDGTDEILSGILMLVVKNEGDQDIQYGEITLDVGDQQGKFTLTTLPAGQSMVLLEQNRMAYDKTVDYTSLIPMADNVAYFTEPLSCHEDKLKINIQDGAINVTNISEEDIPGNIAVYYKNAASDIFYGGITYRISIEGGLKAGEIRQTMTNHASDTGSRIVFVTISQ